MGSVGVVGPLRLLMVATVVICRTRGTELDYINHEKKKKKNEKKKKGASG